MKVGESGEISIILYSKPIRMKFTGKISAKLDAKGRVFFPAAFRKLLVDGEGDFVLRRDVYQPCLVVYPLVVWEEEVALLRQRLNRWDPRQAMVFRQFMSDAELISLDSSGRFLLPKRLTEIAQIDKELVFVGVDDRIELWNKNQMSTSFMSPEDFGESLAQLMSADSE